jgi:methylated-DNA-protein-cysteine methyltransferase-like protein
MNDPIIQQDFFERVYEVVRLIPYGRVSTYGVIGKYLGSGRSARMVGWAMNNCHQKELGVPAHRVVNRNGLLTGRHFFVETPMEDLLQQEGIVVKDYQIQDFELHFWDPSIELAL